jgi:hypothetical protein
LLGSRPVTSHPEPALHPLKSLYRQKNASLIGDCHDGSVLQKQSFVPEGFHGGLAKQVGLARNEVYCHQIMVILIAKIMRAHWI